MPKVLLLICSFLAYTTAIAAAPDSTPVAIENSNDLSKFSCPMTNRVPSCCSRGPSAQSLLAVDCEQISWGASGLDSPIVKCTVGGRTEKLCCQKFQGQSIAKFGVGCIPPQQSNHVKIYKSSDQIKGVDPESEPETYDGEESFLDNLGLDSSSSPGS